MQDQALSLHFSPLFPEPWIWALFAIAVLLIILKVLTTHKIPYARILTVLAFLFFLFGQTSLCLC